MSDGHFRILTIMPSGRMALQGEHFKSREDAEAYIERYRDVIVPGERAEIVADFDSRQYPMWRPNRP